MSHYCKVTLKMEGSVESLVRTLVSLGIDREHIEVHDVRKTVKGYGGKNYGKAHVIVRKKDLRKLRGLEKSPRYGDLGFEQKTDGSWDVHTDNLNGITKTWQKRLLSKWAIQKIGMQAEASGHSWDVRHGTEDQTQAKYAYVHVTQRW